jgi:hypothetical protein
LKIVIAVSPMPMLSPRAWASGPLTTTATPVRAMSRIITSVTSICSGRSFQIGRPSSTSNMMFEARMNAPT